MQLIKALITLLKRKVVSAPKLEFLNATEILFIERSEDKRGFLYLDIEFNNGRKLSLRFSAEEDLTKALKEITTK